MKIIKSFINNIDYRIDKVDGYITDKIPGIFMLVKQKNKYFVMQYIKQKGSMGIWVFPYIINNDNQTGKLDNDFKYIKELANMSNIEPQELTYNECYEMFDKYEEEYNDEISSLSQKQILQLIIKLESKPILKAYYMNTDNKYIRNGGRKAPIISLDEFKSILNKTYVKKYKTRFEDNLSDNFDYTTHDYLPYMLNDLCGKDLEKIAYNDENITKDICNVNIKGKELSGLKVTSTGIPFYGYYCGGDGGGVIFMISYWDGKKLRGYIPIAGNTVNKDKTAFRTDLGNDEETIIKFNGGIEPADSEWCEIAENVGFDFDWILKDIENRIQIIRM